MFFRRRLARDATLSYLPGRGSRPVGIAVAPVPGDGAWCIDEAAMCDAGIAHGSMPPRPVEMDRMVAFDPGH